MTGFNDKMIENRLLNNSNYEDELEKKIQQEILEAKTEKERVPHIVKDQKQVSQDLIWHSDTIYRVYNRKLKTESLVRGDQAESLVKYTDYYVVRFDHRIEYS